MSCALIPCVRLSTEVECGMGDGVALGVLTGRDPQRLEHRAGSVFWDSGWGLRLNQGSGKKTTISSEW